MNKKQKKMLARIIIAAVLLIVLHFVPITGIPRFICYLAVYLVIGYDIVKKAFKGIKNGQVFDENFLMSIATIGAFGVGEFAEAVGVMMFYRIGEYLKKKLWNEVVPRSWMSLICDLKLSTLLMIMEMSL